MQCGNRSQFSRFRFPCYLPVDDKNGGLDFLKGENVVKAHAGGVTVVHNFGVRSILNAAAVLVCSRLRV